MIDTIDTAVYAERLERARASMHAHALDFLLVGPGADLLYLLGAQSRQTERLTLLIVPQDGPTTILLPAFEAATLPPLPRDVHLVKWGESDNPARIAAGIISSVNSVQPGGMYCTCGVSDALYSVFLLRLQAELPRAAFTTAGPVLSTLRQIKDEREIELLAASSAVADRVFTTICDRPFVGRSEMEIGREIAAMLEASGLTVPGFPIVASGPNSASPHHHTGTRQIERGDVVVLDFGGTFQGYYSDITRTVFVGNLPDEGSERMRVYNLVAKAQDAAVRTGRPGMSCEQLDSVAREILTGGGYGEFFTHRLGHGIGLDGHEPPYLVQGNTTLLRAGMAATIEPGLYLPSDFGVRIEDTVVFTNEGIRRLNNVTHDAVVIN
ncbi:MAG TPA: Xaa-Pro peptidase family protein [Chloroflexia bacterium]|nr:Xaa-Pro peptidase family protein [Chloroflexia bacterium]